MKHPDIVVVGTGRSGTSFCAYVLQERLGVCMAHQHQPTTKKVYGGYPHSVGSYEEMSMMMLTRQLVKRRDLRKFRWLETFGRIHAKCKGLVGIKQCRLAIVNKKHWNYIRPRLVVRTFRPENLTVASMVRFRRPANYQYWKRFYWQLENNMRRIVDVSEFLCPVVFVDFSERVSEAALERKLMPYVKALRKGQ